MLFLDRAQLLRDGSILLGAIGNDGNKGLFYLVFAIINNKKDENQAQYILTLCNALYDEDDYDKIITFILGLFKGLVNAIVKVFPSSPYGNCLRHLQANSFKSNSWLGIALNNERGSLIVKVAYTYTSSKYEEAMITLFATLVQAHN